jgi:hypothetical protein
MRRSSRLALPSFLGFNGSSRDRRFDPSVLDGDPTATEVNHGHERGRAVMPTTAMVDEEDRAHGGFCLLQRGPRDRQASGGCPRPRHSSKSHRRLRAGDRQGRRRRHERIHSPRASPIVDQRLLLHDRGKVLVQASLMLAGSAERCADIEHLRLELDLSAGCPLT